MGRNPRTAADPVLHDTISERDQGHWIHGSVQHAGCTKGRAWRDLGAEMGTSRTKNEGQVRNMGNELAELDSKATPWSVSEDTDNNRIPNRRICRADEGPIQPGGHASKAWRGVAAHQARGSTHRTSKMEQSWRRRVLGSQRLDGIPKNQSERRSREREGSRHRDGHMHE